LLSREKALSIVPSIIFLLFMMTSETVPPQTMAKNKLPLWFWIVFALFIVSTLLSMSLYTAKYTQLVVAAKQDQKPLVQQWQLLLNESDVLQSNWLKTLNPLVKKIQGDLIWSSQQQKGVMRFANLPELPAGQRYHLWIYDLEHSLKEPISATRFQADSHRKKEFLVAIFPEKRVQKPYKFVLKLESASQPEQILLLAQP
jgi:hypothetical protein